MRNNKMLFTIDARGMQSAKKGNIDFFNGILYLDKELVRVNENFEKYPLTIFEKVQAKLEAFGIDINIVQKTEFFHEIVQRTYYDNQCFQIKIILKPGLTKKDDYTFSYELKEIDDGNVSN